MDNLQTLTRNNIWAALDDYFRHVDSHDVYENISEEFVDRLADDAIKSKRSLRELFRKSQGWNENLQAIVINGTKTHKLIIPTTFSLTILPTRFSVPPNGTPTATKSP